MEKKNCRVLTDVEVFPAWSEFESQRKGCEELELLRELERPIGRVGPVALPPLEPFGRVVAGAVAVEVHHVQDVALRPVFRDGVLVVRAENVQVVVDADVDVVVAPLEPAGRGERCGYSQSKGFLLGTGGSTLQSCSGYYSKCLFGAV